MGAEPARRPLVDAAAKRTFDAEQRVRRALRELDSQAAAVTFAAVAERARPRPRAGARPPAASQVTSPAASPMRPAQSPSVLDAVLERITYANEDTGYTIARVATERTGPDLLTVVGPLLGAQIGESLRLTGRWSSHPRYGKQFQVDSYATVLPATIQGIRRYLGSG